MTGCSISGAGTELRRRSSASASDAGRDGAIAEAGDQLTGGTRADFLRPFRQGQFRSQERFEPGAARAAGGPNFAQVPSIPRRTPGTRVG